MEEDGFGWWVANSICFQHGQIINHNFFKEKKSRHYKIFNGLYKTLIEKVDTTNLGVMVMWDHMWEYQQCWWEHHSLWCLFFLQLTTTTTQHTTTLPTSCHITQPPLQTTLAAHKQPQLPKEMTATTQPHNNHMQQGQKLAKDYQRPGKTMTGARHSPRAVNDVMSEPGHVAVSDMVTMQYRPMTTTMTIMLLSLVHVWYGKQSPPPLWPAT